MDLPSERAVALPLALACCVGACTPRPGEEPAPASAAPESTLVARGDLGEIRERGALRLLVPAGGGDAALLARDASPAEAERALAERFAASLGLRAERVAVEDRSRLLELLEAGRGDLAVAQLTVTEARSERVSFTRATTTVDEWLVGRRGASDLPRSIEELAGRDVHVRPTSSYAETLERLAGLLDPPPHLVAVDEAHDTEVVLYEVGRGERPLTIADDNLLDAVEDYNPDVERLVRLARDRAIAWAVRRDNPQLRAAANAFLMGELVTAHSREPSTGDLPAIRERGSLRVLTLNSPLHYYLHRGIRRGFDYEIARLAARELELRLDVIAAPSRAALVPWLLEGRGDLIAAGLAAEAPPEAVAVTRPYLLSREVLAQHEGAPALADLSELAGRAVHVRGGSTHELTLRALVPKLGPFQIVTADEDLDETMRRVSASRGLDWRLMAAVAQQESRWDPEARSHAGAVGLFQLMPRTANALGHTNLQDPEVSARAAVEHMADLLDRLPTRIPLKHRVRLALAAWNAGWGHLADARRLAEEQGLSPDKWFNHVERAMALLERPGYYNRTRYGYVRARETISFVSQVQLRYDHYVSLLPP